jgi:hydrogenase nickel incorporation protein HypA/HybF
MHELSIAMSIVELASEEAQMRSSPGVAVVYLKLGPLSGVVKESLIFSYEIACQGTLLEGSKLLIEEVPIRIYCPACGQSRAAESIQSLCCVECGAPSSNVVEGRELMVTALELRE